MALYVDPDLWGNGIGSQLLEQAMDSFRTAGCTVAELWVMDGNERAQQFYRSLGWHPVAGHKRENVRGIEVDEVCFQAAL
jgi:GNAT superfamily N-acetyltransferase